MQQISAYVLLFSSLALQFYFKCFAACMLSIVAVTNDHRFNGLKQQRFMISQLCMSEVWVGSALSSALSFKGQNQGVSLLGSYQEALGKIYSKFI